MTTLIGSGDTSGVVFPRRAAALIFGLGPGDTVATLRILASTVAEPVGRAPENDRTLSLVVSHAALRRLFGWRPAAENGKSYHLPFALREIATALRDCPDDAARNTYRLAKSIELLCETGRLLATCALVPMAPLGSLSLADSRRLVDVRRLIDERWAEKLTLDDLARACGINRAKLTRGFRDLYRCSVAEALSERRLSEASRRLVTTDLPVSTIGYDSGYLNNASFARAFGRRFGVSPSAYRDGRAALAG